MKHGWFPSTNNPAHPLWFLFLQLFLFPTGFFLPPSPPTFISSLLSFPAFNLPPQKSLSSVLFSPSPNSIPFPSCLFYFTDWRASFFFPSPTDRMSFYLQCVLRFLGRRSLRFPPSMTIPVKLLDGLSHIFFFLRISLLPLNAVLIHDMLIPTFRAVSLTPQSRPPITVFSLGRGGGSWPPRFV